MSEPTIRARVLTFAAKCARGFTDEELRTLDPDAPESSFRKRRTELADDGLIVDSGTKRPKKNGQLATVWIHRKFHPAPPPIPEKVKGTRSKALERRRREALMFNALVTAAPHHQGGKSQVGAAIAEALGIPFPISVNNLPALRPL